MSLCINNKNMAFHKTNLSHGGPNGGGHFPPIAIFGAFCCQMDMRHVSFSSHISITMRTRDMILVSFYRDWKAVSTYAINQKSCFLLRVLGPISFRKIENFRKMLDLTRKQSKIQGSKLQIITSRQAICVCMAWDWYVSIRSSIFLL